MLGRLETFLAVAFFALGSTFSVVSLRAQEIPQPAPNAPSPKPPEPPAPAQIELLETRVRFETNGDSRKEVHTRVHINSELGVRQFARLNFDYNRAFQEIHLPLVRITHASGGTADILPSAITDQPNPAVTNAPAYQDVRVKSIRILGLEPSDTLEYRVVTTTTHHPLAPDFWLDHTFDRSGIVSKEVLEIDLPSSLAPAPADTGVIPLDNKPLPTQHYDPFRVPTPGKAVLFVNPDTPITSTQKSSAEAGRTVFIWRPPFPKTPASTLEPRPSQDVQVALSRTWAYVSVKLYGRLVSNDPLPAEITDLSRKLTKGASTPVSKAERIYAFVSQKIPTVDLPLGATGFSVRPATEIAQSVYATTEDKFSLFTALAKAAGLQTLGLLAQEPPAWPVHQVPYPVHFAHLLVWIPDLNTALDPSVEVAPYGVVAANLRGKPALGLEPYVGYRDAPQVDWTSIPKELPFAASQRVNVDAQIATDGTLSAKVHYTMRGDNELELRAAFHQTPTEKWKEVAQLLALSDGFRGKVTKVTASDPYATKEPFTVEYEITQPKFVDWSKKPVRIPALLPLVSLPDPPAKSAAGNAHSPVELGTPLDVQTRVTLHVPPDTSVRAPVGISVERDYATFASEYSARDLTLTAERHINFLLREVPAAHAADYAAFVRSVQNDQAQEFVLERGDSPQSPTARGKACSTPSSQP